MKKIFPSLFIFLSFISTGYSNAAEVKIYGRANISLDYLDDGKDYNVFTVTSNASRLGFKAEQVLENGMTAFMQIEQEINLSTGNNDTKANTFATRDTFAGIRSEQYGQLRIGRFDTPFKNARNAINLFGDMTGDMRNLTRAENLKFDERNDNTLEYQSPIFAGGFKVLAATSMQSGVQVAQQDNADETSDTKAYDIAVHYKKGAIDSAVAYQKFQQNASGTTAATARDAVRLTAAYQITDTLKIGAMYQHSAYAEPTEKYADANIYALTGAYKFTPKTALRAEYIYRQVDAQQRDSTMFALGVEHQLDRSFSLYANAAEVFNDANANLAPWREGRANANASSPVMAAQGQNALAISAGFRYDF